MIINNLLMSKTSKNALIENLPNWIFARLKSGMRTKKIRIN